MSKPETFESLLHDMRGFLECWSMWLMPGSPINIRSRDWFVDFVTRLAALCKQGAGQSPSPVQQPKADNPEAAEYTPYGESWRKEIMRWRKDQIVDTLVKQGERMAVWRWLAERAGYTESTVEEIIKHQKESQQ